MKRLKQYLVNTLLIVLLLTTQKNSFSQTTISPYLFGQNAWLPDSIQNDKIGGKLNRMWGYVEDCNIKLVRIGGISYDDRLISHYQILNLIDSIRNIGAEPLIQVSWSNNAYTSAQAADLVDFVNNIKNRNIKFWSISNEPKLSHSASTNTVATFFKSFASAMKLKDPTIKIVGPDFAWYNTASFTKLLGGIEDISGVDANGNYYLDIVSYHAYPFDGTQNRADVVGATASDLRPDIESLLAKMSTANTLHGRTGTDTLKWAITEFNVNYRNPASNDASGVGVSSFLNGQLWAEMFGLGMEYNASFICPWSIHESGGSSSTYDLGFINGSGTYNPRSNYYHEQLLANTTRDFYETYASSVTDVRTFGSYNNDSISVVILNMSQQSYDYEVFNNNTGTSSEPLVINATSLNLSGSYTDNIAAECTQLLVFNSLGQIIHKYTYCLNDAIAQLPPNLTNLNGGPTSINIPIATGDDDVEEKNDNSMYLNSSDLEIVNDGGDIQTIGLRFQNVTVPMGANIVNAYVQFQVDEVSTGVATYTIKGEAADNSTTFLNTTSNATARPTTTATQTWIPVDWTSVGAQGLNQRTSNIVAIVQEITSRSGWSNGNSLSIIISGTGTNKRVAEAYEGDQSGVAILHVEYIIGIAPVPDVVSLPSLNAQCSISTLTAPTANSATITGTHNASLPITANTTITWTYDDGGVTSIQTQSVVINDNTLPLADVTNLVTINAQCSVSNLTAPTATDNCSGTITGTHNASLPITANTTITWSYNDGNGNIETQSQNVVITSINATISNNGGVLTANNTNASYRWLDCNNGNTAIPGGNGISFSPTISGSYAVEVTQNGCVAISSCENVVITTINEKGMFSVVSIYPNPNDGRVNIILGNLKEVTISVLNTNGELIYFKDKINTPLHQFELKTAKGIYFIKLQTEEAIKYYKLVKN